MTSAVTRTPRALACRSTSTDPAVETWQTCSRDPTCSASSTSRAMIASSATAGQPVRPSRVATSPSCICAPSVSRGSSACWAMTPSNAFTYSRARRISRASATQCPSSEKIRTRAADVGHRAQLGQVLAGEPHGDRPDRLHVDQAGLATEPPHLLDDAGRVGDRRGVGHRAHRGVAAERRGPGAGLDGLGVLAAGFAQVGVQVDETRQGDQPVGVDRRGARGRAAFGDHPVADEQVGRLAAEHAHALDDVRHLPPSKR